MSKLLSWGPRIIMGSFVLTNLKHMYNNICVDENERILLQNPYDNHEHLKNINKWRKSGWISQTFTLPKNDYENVKTRV